MKGSGIRNVLEQACFKINPDDVNDYYGSFGYQVANPNCSVKLFFCVSKLRFSFMGLRKISQVAGLRFEVVVTADNAGDRVKNLNVKNEDGNYGDIDDEAIYNVALPRQDSKHTREASSMFNFSFLAGNFHGNKTQRQVKSQGIFDEDILSHVPGDKTIYQAMRDWVRENTPIHQEVEGRFTITSIDGNLDGNSNKRSGSNSHVPSLIIALVSIAMIIF